MSPTALDEPTFFTLTHERLLPCLAQHHQHSAAPVRIWSIGCQAGDEALLLLLRLVSAQAAAQRDGDSAAPLRFTIFATDPDASAVQAARQLASSDRLQERASLAPYHHLLQASQHGLSLPRTLRQSLVFGTHDPLIHPPFAHLELIVCAQSLAPYTNAQQRDFFQRWAHALLPHGLLLLLVPTAVAPDARLYRPCAVTPALLFERTAVSVTDARDARGSQIERPWITSAVVDGSHLAPQRPEEDNTGLIAELQATLEEQLVHIQELEETARMAQRAIGAEQRLAAIVASSDDAILSKDLDGVVTSWNAAAERLYGYRAEEMIGQSVLRLYPPEEVEEFHRNMACIRRGECVEHYDTFRLRRDGTRVPVSVTISPIKDYAGATTGASTIARDISARYALERQREAFLDLVTHELKTPLTTLRINLQLAQRRQRRLLAAAERLSDDERQAVEETLSLLARSQRPLRTQQRLVDDLLDVARLEEGKLAIHVGVCNLVELVAQTVQDHHIAYPARLITLDLPEADIVAVRADPDRVQQALGNYLTNALKFSPASEPVHVGLAVERAMARVWVQDAGPGLSPVQQAQIWEQYYQAPTPAQSGWKAGLGLGLYICQQLIERQGGQVGVESQPGCGATFWFTLPLADLTTPA